MAWVTIENSQSARGTHTRRRYVPDKKPAPPSTMKTVHKVCGVEVDDDTYRRYAEKPYTTTGGDLSLLGIELYATSKELAAAFPEEAEEARKIYKGIVGELTGRKDTVPMKHDNFSGYLSDLNDIHTENRERYAALFDDMESARKKYDDSIVGGVADVVSQAEYTLAEDKFKKGLEALQTETATRIAEVRAQMKGHLDEFYTAAPQALDEKTVALLNSGILTEAEMEKLARDNRSNPTMTRFIGAHIQKYVDDIEKKNPSERAYYSKLNGFGAQLSGIGHGEKELEAFDALADWEKRCLDNSRKTGERFSVDWDNAYKNQTGLLSDIWTQPEE